MHFRPSEPGDRRGARRRAEAGPRLTQRVADVDRSEVTRLVESRAARVIVVLLMAVPAFLAFNYIYRFGVDAVFWDEWVLVPLVDKLDRGTLSFSDLFAAHSEHRILFPQLLMLGIAEATHFNTLVTMYVSFALL